MFTLGITDIHCHPTHVNNTVSSVLLPARPLQTKMSPTVQSTENSFHCNRRYLILAIVFGVVTLLLLSILLAIGRKPVYRPAPSSTPASPSSATLLFSLHMNDLRESSTEATSSTLTLSPTNTKASIPSSRNKTTTTTISPPEDERCLKPYGNSCTAATPDQTKSEGLGVYYESPCRGVGCNFYGAMCRLCAKHPSLINRPYPKCPACVPDIETF